MRNGRAKEKRATRARFGPANDAAPYYKRPARESRRVAAPARYSRYLLEDELAPPGLLDEAAEPPLLDEAPPGVDEAPPLDEPPMPPALLDEPPVPPVLEPALESVLPPGADEDDEDEPPGTTTVFSFSVVVELDEDAPLGEVVVDPPGTTVVVSLRSHAESAKAPIKTNR